MQLRGPVTSYVSLFMWLFDLKLKAFGVDMSAGHKAWHGFNIYIYVSGKIGRNRVGLIRIKRGIFHSSFVKR